MLFAGCVYVRPSIVVVIVPVAWKLFESSNDDPKVKPFALVTLVPVCRPDWVRFSNHVTVSCNGFDVPLVCTLSVPR